MTSTGFEAGRAKAVKAVSGAAQHQEEERCTERGFEGVDDERIVCT